MVEQVVHGHRSQQVVLVVNHRSAHQVVGGEVASHGGQRGLRSEREQVSVHNSADQLGRRVTKQPLQMHTTQVVPSGRGRGRARDEHH